MAIENNTFHLAGKILEAIGIDPNYVVSMDFHFSSKGGTQEIGLQIEAYPKDNLADMLGTELKKYHLVENTEADSDGV